MSRAAVLIHNQAGDAFPGLSGVFRRAFPTVTALVLRDGVPRAVYYFGITYSISRGNA